METFQTTKKVFKKAFNEILNEQNNYAIDEAALPAYAHKNFFIDYLFWKRVEVAFDLAEKNESKKKVLDFGFGSGVLSYLLAKNGYDVTSCDIELSPFRLVQKKIAFPPNISFLEGDIFEKDLPENSFDIIFALDVLEHIENLTDYIELFKKLLKPNGVIVVSGPTENFLYKLGRQFAGERFSGDYHVTNIAHIKQEFSDRLLVKTEKKLIFPFVLFEIFTANKV